jgi:hypothetical protein
MADDSIEGSLTLNGRIVAILSWKAWLESTLNWLWECKKWREVISWNEAIGHIGQSWLENHGFGPPTVQISALHSALAAIRDREEKALGLPTTGAPPKTSAKSRKGSAPRGPVPFVRPAAEKTLKNYLLTGKINQTHLGPTEKGGLTKEKLSDILCCSRTELDVVVETVLDEQDFVGYREAWRKRHEGRPRRRGKWASKTI